MIPYQEAFPQGTRVKVRDREFLQRFARDWRLHHPLQASQLELAGVTAMVRSIGFYHGGDVLYELEGVPGIWHEACLMGDDAS